jgi:phosphatidyl-myo-inositol alpha-mannosyltransferase
MKIQPLKPKLIISSYDDIVNPNYGGGGAIAIHELAKRLKLNYDISVISWNHSGVKEEAIDGVKYIRIGSNLIAPKLAMLLFQIFLPIISHTREYDLWIECFGPPFTTGFLPIFTSKPVIGVVHMLASQDMKRKYGLSTGFIEKIGLKTYKHIVTTTEQVNNVIKKISPHSNIYTIENGVYLPHANNQILKKQLLYIGRIEIDQKGLDLLIEAFSIFVNKNPNYTLVIAGNGLASEIFKIKKLISQAGLSGKVILPGRVNGEEKEKLFSESIAMIIPSRFETFSMTALESLAHQLPLIAFDIEGLDWIPSNCIYRIKKYDILEMVKTLEDVCLGDERTARLKKNGHNFSKKFSWDNVAKKYVKIFNFLLIK